MDDLIERLEAAERGSRELDYAIKAALEDDEYWRLRVAADWTTSIDAALALAERVLDGDISYDLFHDYGGFNRAKVYAIMDGPVMAETKAETMPLALCAAILRARGPAA